MVLEMKWCLRYSVGSLKKPRSRIEVVESVEGQHVLSQEGHNNKEEQVMEGQKDVEKQNS
jgi:hypothetical protein